MSVALQTAAKDYYNVKQKLALCMNELYNMVDVMLCDN